MRLTALNPEWLRSGGPGVTDAEHKPIPLREGIGLDFDCPCPNCTARRTGVKEQDFHLRVTVFFSNPLDGGPVFDEKTQRARWHRKGETFDNLVLSPSILSDVNKGGCGWHGFVGGPQGDQPGEVVTL